MVFNFFFVYSYQKKKNNFMVAYLMTHLLKAEVQKLFCAFWYCFDQDSQQVNPAVFN